MGGLNDCMWVTFRLDSDGAMMEAARPLWVAEKGCIDAKQAAPRRASMLIAREGSAAQFPAAEIVPGVARALDSTCGSMRKGLMLSVNVKTGQVSRLKDFLRDWRRLRDADTLVRRLERFCASAHRLFPAPLVRHQPDHIDVGQLANLLPRLGPALRRRRTSGTTINPWTAAGLARREVRNAAVLASLWSPMQCGNAGTQFLAEFFALVERPDSLLPSPDELAAGYVVRTEHCLGIDGADRVDLLIESEHHMVGIEVKIDAVEGQRQLARYVEALGRNAVRLGKRCDVILLAPFPPARADVLPATWAYVRAAAEASMPERQSDQSFAHQLIAAFASHVRNF